MCAGLSNPPRRDERLTRTQLSEARNLIRRGVLDVWQPFTRDHRGTHHDYRFVFQVLASRTIVPIQTTDIQGDVSAIAEREQLFRDARSAIEEAHQLSYDNIAIVSPHIAGRPHGISVSAIYGTPYTRLRPDMEMERRLNADGGLLDALPNGMVLDFTRDVASGARTPAHETGHLLGLDNAADLGSIMGPLGTEAQDRARRVTPEDQRLLHALIESNVPGFSRPPEAQTIAPASPFRFDGTYTRADP